MLYGRSFYQFGRSILEEYSERNFSDCPEIDRYDHPPEFLAAWLVAGILPRTVNGSVMG